MRGFFILTILGFMCFLLAIVIMFYQLMNYKNCVDIDFLSEKCIKYINY